MKSFDEVFIDSTKHCTKIKTDQYHEKGKYIIIDQGQSEIAGYTDLENGLFSDVPAIIFGDHTRVIKYIDEPFFIGADGVKVLKSKLENANYKYLFYALKNAKIPNTGYNRHFKWLKETKINYPDNEKQAEIVSILDKLQSIINHRQKQLEKLDELIKARFVEMFGEPIDNPMGWKVKKLSEISTLITNGNTPKGGSENYVDSGILFLRSQNVWRNRIDLEDVAYIDDKTHNKMKKSSVCYNDILITKTGRINTENSSLGRAALYKGEDNSANINGHVYLVRLNNTVDPKFVVTILTGEAYRKYIRKVCVGGIDKRQINLDQVEDFPIIMPPIEKQKEFADFAEQVDKSKVVIQKHLEKAQLLFDSLMQEYFG
ncbi:MAG: restriction endonuclease subunit S [Oscillospiraceae bacterium]|nr:restriction endonuclease subunit S [Oscillospiraceae bacterium]